MDIDYRRRYTAMVKSIGFSVIVLSWWMEVFSFAVSENDVWCFAPKRKCENIQFLSEVPARDVFALIVVHGPFLLRILGVTVVKRLQSLLIHFDTCTRQGESRCQSWFHQGRDYSLYRWDEVSLYQA